MNQHPVWRIEEEAQLIAWRREGWSLIEIAAKLKRPLQGVRHKSSRLKSGVLPLRRRWTKIEDRRLRQLYPEGDTLALAIAFPGRPMKSISQRAAIMGLRRTHRFDDSRGRRLIAALSETQAAYLAGLVDGEGSIIHTGPARQHVRISLGSTCPHVIAFLVEVCGGASYAYPDGGGLGKKPFWRWSLSQTRVAEALIARMRPYMIIK